MVRTAAVPGRSGNDAVQVPYPVAKEIKIASNEHVDNLLFWVSNDNGFIFDLELITKDFLLRCSNSS